MPNDASAILDLIHESVVVQDLDGRVVVWNHASEVLYGVSRLEAVGRNFNDLINSDDAPLIEGARSQLPQSEQWNGELKRTRLDGHELTIEAHWALRRDTSGKPYAIIETGRDISTRKAAEEKLRYSEHRYHNLFQAMAASFWEIDFSGVDQVIRSLYASGVRDFASHFAANPKTVRKMMRAAQVIDVNDQTVKLFGNGDKAALLGNLEPFWPKGSERVFVEGVLSGITHKPSYSTETRLQSIDGRVFDALFTASYPPETMGKGTFVIGVIDISERIKAERALQEIQSDFAHAARVSMLGELTASIAHEVNQPLAAIATNGEAGLRWLSNKVPDLDEVSRLIRRMVDDTRRAAESIGRIRSMATNRSPKQSSIALNTVAEEAASFLRHALQAKEIELSLDLASDLPDITADRVQLQQVVVNLAINAMQAMEHVASEKRIVFKTNRNGDQLEFSVIDTGPGIEGGHEAKVFDSFFTTKQDGMGIGLAICRSMLEAHEGRITAKNNDAVGATFAFTLPVGN
jgi:PAS domain S-box-containing protein